MACNVVLAKTSPRCPALQACNTAWHLLLQLLRTLYALPLIRPTSPRLFSRLLRTVWAHCCKAGSSPRTCASSSRSSHRSCLLQKSSSTSSASYTIQADRHSAVPSATGLQGVGPAGPCPTNLQTEMSTPATWKDWQSSDLHRRNKNAYAYWGVATWVSRSSHPAWKPQAMKDMKQLRACIHSHEKVLFLFTRPASLAHLVATDAVSG